MNTCDLPEDVLIEVLVRAPAETIPRLRCVSKSWQTLIDSPEFKHMRCGGTDQLIFLSEKNHLCVSKCTDSLENMTASLTQIELGKQYETMDAKVISSCNGFMCLLLDCNKIVVMNPCTKQSVELPPCDAYKYSKDAIQCCHVSFGFGYDKVHDDYKVVRMLRGTSMSTHKARVYSLKSKCWKDLKDFCSYFNCTFRGVFANNTLHWLMYIFSYSYVIVALDLANERYHLVSPPAGVDVFSAVGHYLGDVNGCLGLIIYSPLKHEFDVWTMREYGVQNSWTKLTLHLPDTLHLKIFLGFEFKLTVHSKNIFIFRSWGSFIWYDNEKKVSKLIDSSPSIKRNGVFTFTPNLNNLPIQNNWIERVPSSVSISRLCRWLHLK